MEPPEINFDRYRGWLADRDGRPVHLYVIVVEQFVKVGIATEVNVRLSELQIGNPRRLTIAHVSAPLPRDLARRAERLAHNELRPFRVSGEWFECSVDDATIAVARVLAGLEGK